MTQQAVFDFAPEVRREAYQSAKLKFTDQDKKILCTLYYFPCTTALSVFRLMDGSMLLTSIRRSLSNCKDKGYVETTGKKMEMYKVSNTVYKITDAGINFLWK